MSRERWLPHRKVVTVEARPEGGIVVRPRRTSPWSGVAIGTSIAAGLSLSAAIARFQGTEVPWSGGALLALVVSAVIAGFQGFPYRHHPERWRFLAWWCAFTVGKISFIEDSFLFVFFPFDLLALMPAWLETERSARIDEGDLSCIDLRAADIAFIHVRDSDFTGADMRDARLSDLRFERCRFNGVDAGGAHFRNCTFLGCDFQDARLMHTKWSRADAQGCLFARASLTAAEFEASDLRNADFENADLCGTKFWQGNGVDTRLHGARLAAARYDAKTEWTPEVSPGKMGAMRVD